MSTKLSSQKRVRQNEKQKKRNASIRSRVKTFWKKVTSNIQEKNIDESEKALKQFTSVVDKSVKTGVFHKNFARRKKSRLMKQIHTLRTPHDESGGS